MFLTLLVRTRILMRLWSVTNFRFLSLVQADSMDQETQTKVTFMCSSYCGTEARFWYWEPKPRSNFGINIETEFFFSKTETFWNFSHFFCLGDISFENLEIEQRSSKIIKKSWMFGSKFGLRSPFMIVKTPNTIGD